jgi:hypothetical protein
MKLLAMAALIASISSVCATTVVHPPLTPETALGVWEALWCQQPATLWRLELNKTGDSYLVQLTVGTEPVVRRLLSSEIVDGKVKLHFAAARSAGHDFSEIWITGRGEGTSTRGGISAEGFEFTKGTWTRDVAAASKLAQDSIPKSAK